MNTKEAQIALANLKRYISGGGAVDRATNEAIDMAIKALEKPEPHWIPCSERPPETSDAVLTTYIVNGDKSCRYVEESSYYGDDGSWISPWDEYRVEEIEVIAWMPMPEEYRGE